MMAVIKRAGFFLLVVLSSLFFLGDFGAQERSDDYFPLLRGMRWKYSLLNKMKNTRQTLEFTVKGETFLSELGKKITVIDEHFGGVDSPTGYSTDHDGYVVRHLSLTYDEKGELHAGHELLSSQKILPVRPEVGKEWEEKSEVLFNQIHNKNRVATKEKVQVKAGEFADCYLVVTETMQETRYPGEGQPHRFRFVYRDWYAPNVGLVRSLVEDPDLRQVINEIELVEFSGGRERL